MTIFWLIALGVAGRLAPHLPNATPVTAITLAARRELGALWAYVVPLAAMIASDAAIGFYNWKILISVYGSFVLIAALSHFIRHASLGKAIFFAALSSVLFFIVTNSAVWLFSPWYDKSIEGLLYCYWLGLPFLRNMLLGDVLYAAGLLGAFKLAGSVGRHWNGISVVVKEEAQPYQ